ncbi:hypothetical protein H2200_010335 [Cladophialophora chaetospira]|uniref:BTB domain-containing protein n=1 Tax=Cladophialophora chaetospira TaxID=386627 RepID=A0AA38X1A3_9EURO|nr:hypothetical protein H2200_010335 [Cladophialophora chaetospira]
MADINASDQQTGADADNHHHDPPPLITLFEPDAETAVTAVILDVEEKDNQIPPVKLQCSITALTMGFKVFKAMFSKEFAEGQVEVGATSPREIELKDNPKAMEQMCRMLYYQSFDLRPRPFSTLGRQNFQPAVGVDAKSADTESAPSVMPSDAQDRTATALDGLVITQVKWRAAQVRKRKWTLEGSRFAAEYTGIVLTKRLDGLGKEGRLRSQGIGPSGTVHVVT